MQQENKAGVRFQQWKAEVHEPELAAELENMSVQQQADAFGDVLHFGTAGLRGVMGAGTNRMNIYTVAEATQGLANYLQQNAFPKRGTAQYGSVEEENTEAEGKPSDFCVIIGYDTRERSELFAQTAAEVLAGNGISVLYWPQPVPVPLVSYGVRQKKAAAGIMITASHNPKEYNGYKVYGADGCQITEAMAEKIFAEIKKVNPFQDIHRISMKEAHSKGLAAPLPDMLIESYLDAVQQQSVLFGDEAKLDLPIVYTPLHGTGYAPVMKMLERQGFTKIYPVAEQCRKDGSFPTCSVPNPELPETLSMGLKLAEEKDAALVIATDPDCDRLSAAVQKPEGGYRYLSGNETGVLLLDYLCSRRIRHGVMPPAPVMIKTIVTTDMAERIAAHYGVRTINLLIGFKYIGEQMGLLEQNGHAEDCIFAFEESCGYLAGSYVRDKDGVLGVALFCEMAAYYAAKNIDLYEQLQSLYRRFGYCRNETLSHVCAGSAAKAEQLQLMERFRRNLSPSGCCTQLAGKSILQMIDYSGGRNNLPPSDMLEYRLEQGASVIVRPSGTEPKLKIYLSVSAETPMEAEDFISALKSDILKFVNNDC